MSLSTTPTLMHEIDELDPWEDATHERDHLVEDPQRVPFSPDDPSLTIQIGLALLPNQ